MPLLRRIDRAYWWVLAKERVIRMTIDNGKNYTKAELKRLGEFPVTRWFRGKYAIEDIDQMRRDCALEFGPIVKENDEGFYFASGAFIFKQRIHRVTYGIVKLKSTDYVFIPNDNPVKSYGQIKAMIMTPYGFYINALGGEKIEYWVQGD